MTNTNTADLRARIAWSLVAEPGSEPAALLIEEHGAAEALRRARGSGMRWRQQCSERQIDDVLALASKHGLEPLLPGDDRWPAGLAELGHRQPWMLWTKGDQGLLGTTTLAVTGARACTGYGSHATAEIVDGVSEQGITVLAGGAYGIDAAVHRSALSNGRPTVTVLAGGLDRPYPAAHAQLLERIAMSGLVVSEMPPGTAPTRWRFLMRSRLMAALGGALLVTEAGARSGSLAAAGEAADLSKPVGALPGPVTSAASAGCHLLIRDHGARLVTSAADALALVASGSRTEGAAS
ncbi:DNA-processing protein DprA [Leucobacter chromiireducens]|uniref:DNA-processing protein DprA n=1 Tax=Leucobacter chromiireducens TaxID=283877 RepID=UPI000F64001E|nr:DNA-processing protein DprA [Leucobacter chromiireducens]